MTRTSAAGCAAAGGVTPLPLPLLPLLCVIREVRLLEPVLVDYRSGEGLTIVPIRTDNSSRAVHRRSHREIQRARRNLHKKINLRPFPKRLRQAEKNAAGGKIFGERFVIVAFGEYGYPQLQRIADCASMGASVAGSGRRA